MVVSEAPSPTARQARSTFCTHGKQRLHLGVAAPHVTRDEEMDGDLVQVLREVDRGAHVAAARPRGNSGPWPLPAPAQCSCGTPSGSARRPTRAAPAQ